MNSLLPYPAFRRLGIIFITLYSTETDRSGAWSAWTIQRLTAWLLHAHFLAILLYYFFFLQQESACKMYMFGAVKRPIFSTSCQISVSGLRQTGHLPDQITIQNVQRWNWYKSSTLLWVWGNKQPKNPNPKNLIPVLGLTNLQFLLMTENPPLHNNTNLVQLLTKHRLAPYSDTDTVETICSWWHLWQSCENTPTPLLLNWQWLNEFCVLG